MPRPNGTLTHREQAFARHYAGTGDLSYAAQKAGYSSPSGGGNALRRPSLKARIANIREEQLAKAFTVAIAALVEIAGDQSKAPAARVSAADKICKTVHAYKEVPSEADGDLDGMTLIELQVFSLRALETANRAAALLLEESHRRGRSPRGTGASPERGRVRLRTSAQPLACPIRCKSR